MSFKTTLRLLTLPAALFLTACGNSPVAYTPPPPAPPAPRIVGPHGTVHSGLQLVSGSTIQLYAVGNNGDGSAATPLLTSAVTTDASGSFDLSNFYTCPSASTLVYLAGTGGNPGLSPAVNNPAAILIAALGPCGDLNSSTVLTVNELTTVAAVSALAPFTTSLTAIGSSTTDLVALQSAFNTASQFVSVASGTTPGNNIPTGFTVPSAELATLANILAACVHTSGGIAGDGSACGQLFTLTTPPAGSAPTNTLSAMLDLAKNPTLNTTPLFNLTSVNSPFQPQLTSAPSSFAVALASPAPQPSLQFTPSSITFPNTAAGFTTAVQIVTIQSSGSAAATLGPFSLTGPQSSEFTQVNDCPASLPPGSSCQVQITAVPSVTGPRTASLSIPTNTPNSPQGIALSVTGTAPSAGPLTLSATSLSYTIAGTYQDLTLTNLGTIPVTFQSFTFGPTTFDIPTFNIAVNTCGTMLPPQSICILTLQGTGQPIIGNYTPATSSGSLTIVDDAVTSPQTISLSATNAEKVTNPIDFGAVAVGSTASQTVSVDGTTRINSANFSGNISGANASDFSPNPAGCQNNNSGFLGQNCTFPVNFTPTASGPRTARLGPDTGYILLSGIGTGSTPTPAFTVPSSGAFNAFINLSNVASGSASVTIVNTGSTTLNFGTPTLFASNPTLFQISGNCTAVAPGTSCDVPISFSQSLTAPADFTASLVLRDSASAITRTVSITVHARFSPPIISPSSFTFPNQPAGTTSAPQTFTVSGQNGAPLGHPLSLTLEDTNSPPQFVLSGNQSCPASTTALCTFAVSFAPTVARNFPYSAGVSVLDTVTQLSTFVGFSGLATSPPVTGAPAVTLSPSPLTFPSRAIGSTSLPSAITLTNSGTGNAPLTLSGISLQGTVSNNFTQTNNCPASLATNATCTISVTFAPTLAGAQSATLQVLSNASTSPNTVPISGTAQ